jgi:hypothetical protein
MVFRKNYLFRLIPMDRPLEGVRAQRYTAVIKDFFSGVIALIKIRPSTICLSAEHSPVTCSAKIFEDFLLVWRVFCRGVPPIHGCPRISERAVSTAAVVLTLLLTLGSGQSAGIGTPSMWPTRAEFNARDGEAVWPIAGATDCAPWRKRLEFRLLPIDSVAFRNFGGALFRFFVGGWRTGGFEP